jgi:hypothetical protein
VTRGASSTVVLLGLPPFLYAAGLVLAGLSGAAFAGVLLTFVFVLAVGLYAFLFPGIGTWVAAGVYLTVGAVILSVSFAPSGLAGAEFAIAWGALAAGPAVSLLSFCHPDEGLGTRIVGLQIAIADGLLLLATRAAVAGTGAAASPQGLVAAYFTAIGQQAGAVVSLLTLQGTVNAPVGNVFDPWYIALAAFPVLALCLTFLGPSTGRGDPLPTQDARDPEPVDPALELPASFRSVLSARSRPRAAPLARLPGLRAFAGAAALAGGYVVVAYVAPGLTLPLTSVAAVVFVGVVAAVVRRPIAPAPSPGGGAPAVPAPSPTGGASGPAAR